MQTPVIGLAWPEEHPNLRFMAEVLEISLRFTTLRAQAHGDPGPSQVDATPVAAPCA